MQIVSDDVNNDSDAEATSSSETESVVDDGEGFLEEELSDIDVFEEEIKMLKVMNIKNLMTMIVAQKMKLK